MQGATASALALRLVKRGALRPEALALAVRRQKVYGGALDTVLLELGLVSEAVLWDELSQLTGLPPAPNHLLAGHLDADPLWDAATARRVGAVALRPRGSAQPFTVVARAGFDQPAVATALASSPTPTFYVAPEPRFLALIGSLYGEPVPPRILALLARLIGAPQVRRWTTPESLPVIPPSDSRPIPNSGHDRPDPAPPHPAPPSSLPVTSQSLPVIADVSPVGPQSLPVVADSRLPVIAEAPPTQSQSLPVIAEAPPAQSQSLPVTSQSLPVIADASPVRPQSLPVPASLWVPAGREERDVEVKPQVAGRVRARTGAVKRTAARDGRSAAPVQSSTTRQPSRPHSPAPARGRVSPPPASPPSEAPAAQAPSLVPSDNAAAAVASPVPLDALTSYIEHADTPYAAPIRAQLIRHYEPDAVLAVWPSSTEPGLLALATLLAAYGHRAAATLHSLLASPMPAHRLCAARALGSPLLPTLEPEPALLETARHDPDPAVRAAAFTALRVHRDQPAVAPLLTSLYAQLASPASGLVSAAAAALGWLRDPGAVPPLIDAFAALESAPAPDEAARMEVHDALVVITAHEPRPATAAGWRRWWQRAGSQTRPDWLFAALDDPDPVRRYAAAADLAEASHDQRFGYAFDLPRPQRRRAAARWHLWWTQSPHRPC